MAIEILDTAGTIHSFVEMRRRAQEGGPKRLAVVMADNVVVLTAVSDAFKLGLAYPVLIGSEEKIRAKATAGIGRAVASSGDRRDRRGGNGRCADGR